MTAFGSHSLPNEKIFRAPYEPAPRASVRKNVQSSFPGWRGMPRGPRHLFYALTFWSGRSASGWDCDRTARRVGDQPLVRLEIGEADDQHHPTLVNQVVLPAGHARHLPSPAGDGAFVRQVLAPVVVEWRQGRGCP